MVFALTSLPWGGSEGGEDEGIKFSFWFSWLTLLSYLDLQSLFLLSCIWCMAYWFLPCLWSSVPVWIALIRPKLKDQVSRALGPKEVPHSTAPYSLWTSNVLKPPGLRWYSRTGRNGKRKPPKVTARLLSERIKILFTSSSSSSSIKLLSK